MSTLMTLRDTPTNSKPLSQSLRIEAAFSMGMDGLQSARGMSVEQARAGGCGGGCRLPAVGFTPTFKVSRYRQPKY